MVRLAVVFLAAALGAAVLPAAAACRLALALGLDVSASVDAQEYLLQREGLTVALETPAVQKAFLAMPGADVQLYVFEWSGPATQRPLAPWRAIRAPADLAAVAALLRAPGGNRRDATTAIGLALRHGGRALARHACWRRVIDLSGDGESNSGPDPRSVPLPGITVNGLVIGTQEIDYSGTEGQAVWALKRYYQRAVIRGPGAFVLIALGFHDFARAMEVKLLREVQSVPGAEN